MENTIKFIIILLIVLVVLGVAIAYGGAAVNYLKTSAEASFDVLTGGVGEQPGAGYPAYTAVGMARAFLPVLYWQGGPTWAPWETMIGLLRAVGALVVGALVLRFVLRIAKGQ